MSSSSKFFAAARRATFIAFWLCKFVFGSHPHYAIKPLYFLLAIKISAGVSLPLAPMFLGHLYVQLDILHNDENQAGSCHIVTSSVHCTILQQWLFERCAQYLTKCRSVRFAREKCQSCPRVITDFCGRFESDFPLAFRWSGLKPIGYSVVESLMKVWVSLGEPIEIWVPVTLVRTLSWVRLLTPLGLLLHWSALIRLGSPILPLPMSDGCLT